ncbi:hypothetical protein GCM10023224_14260 [Streptomonospora halophila]|uniref:DUF6879 domain-containing protein n=1 Tax=Streptomonospora halophila TaxID=427369 RepID=A0ABP9GIQ6_9ACTN
MAHLEERAPLPEVVVLGGRVLFLVRYESQGRACGAWRIEDRDAIAATVADLAALFDGGTPLLDYFEREIAPLPAPAVGS